MQLPEIKLKSNHFSDHNYSFRKNTLEKLDEWLPGVQSGDGTNEFYDTKILSSNEFETDTDPLLAEVYFRLDSDQIMHTRTVFDFMDWLGALGGVPDVLLFLIGFFLVSYSEFHAKIQIINDMYFGLDKDQDDQGNSLAAST